MSADARTNRRAALLSIGSNGALTLAKLVLGVVTGSVAVLSEAAHSASDLVASLIASAAARPPARPPDDDHPYGHEKAENLAAAVEGFLVVAAGAAVMVEATRRLVTGASAIDHIGLAIAVMGGSAAVNVVVAARLRRVARRTGSPAIEGDAAHLTADIWTSAGTAAGLVLVALTGWTPLDAVAAIAVSAYVLAMGVRLCVRAAHVLLDSSLPPDELAVIEGVLAGFSTDGVSFHKVRARRAGSKRHVDMHMVVPPDTTVRHGHTMSGRVKGAVREALPNAEVLIHLEDH